MENLFDKISNDIKSAMLAKDRVRLDALRGIKKEFLEAKTAKGADGDLHDDVAQKILLKMVKQRKDSAAIYTSQNRADLAEKEIAEVGVIEGYLPKQLSAGEVETAVRKIITQIGAVSAKDMGKVMGVASKALAGKTENRLVAETVKRLLPAD
ncbi:MAG: GatB/YqeY domain-containing protein [Dysgonamonadaceae bacterium]|nr:GatB/YqeY domain-containing protein [Dysgonamonadaceae bacterium]